MCIAWILKVGVVIRDCGYFLVKTRRVPSLRVPATCGLSPEPTHTVIATATDPYIRVGGKEKYKHVASIKYKSMYYNMYIVHM